MAKFFIASAFILVAFLAISYAAEAEAPTAPKTEITDSDKKKDAVVAKKEVADDLQTAAGGWGFGSFGFPRGGWGLGYNGWGGLYNRPAYPFVAGWGAPLPLNGWGWGALRGGWGWNGGIF